MSFFNRIWQNFFVDKKRGVGRMKNAFFKRRDPDNAEKLNYNNPILLWLEFLQRYAKMKNIDIILFTSWLRLSQTKYISTLFETWTFN